MNLSQYHTLGEDYRLCTGCAACAASCLLESISMCEDSEGFLQPQIDIGSCNDCGICKKVCPIAKPDQQISHTQQQEIENQYPSIWAAWNLDENIRYNSSSGGVFSVLAKDVLKKDGAIVGAAFDSEFAVHHCIIEKMADLHKLQRAKYLQSIIDPNLYKKVRQLLKKERIVLFSGTPCQVAGLRNLLKKDYDNLLCCDILCHGVPSPKLFKRYLKEKSKMNQIKTVKFRDKKTGWKKFSFNIEFTDGNKQSDFFFTTHTC